MNKQEYADKMGLCEEAVDGWSDDISWGELAELTHITQVERFGWCSCEDNEGQDNPYTDCPTQ
jgi:hypothetical protein